MYVKGCKGLKCPGLFPAAQQLSEGEAFGAAATYRQSQLVYCRGMAYSVVLVYGTSCHAVQQCSAAVLSRMGR